MTAPSISRNKLLDSSLAGSTMYRSFRHKLNNSRRKGLRRNEKLSLSELDADINHEILRELKKEVKTTKGLQRKWEVDKTRAEVDEDYKYHARQIVKAAEKLRKRLELPLECVAELKEEARKQRQAEIERDAAKPISEYRREPPVNRHSTKSDNYREASERNRQSSRSDYPSEVHVIDTSREVLKSDYQGYPSRQKSRAEYQRNQNFEAQDETDDMDRKRKASSSRFQQSTEPPKKRRSVNELDEVRRKLADLEAERNSLRDQNKKFEDDMRNIQNEYRATDAEKKKLEDENQKLKNERNQLQIEIRSIQTGYQQVEAGRRQLENDIDESRAKIQRLETENSGLKLNLEENKKQQTDLRRKYAEGQQELANHWQQMEERKNMTAKLETENSGLKLNLEENKKQQTDLHRKYAEGQQELANHWQQMEERKNMTAKLETENTGLRMKLEENQNQQTDLLRNLKQVEQKYDESQQELVTNRQQLTENEKMTEELIQQSERFQNEIRNLHSSLQHQRNIEEDMKNTIDKLQSNLSAERASKEEALTRLSAFAGNKLRDNNPGITDLSDPNRPMKLAEKVSELYDNEWTNAMENLEDLDIEEEQGIKILLDLFMEVYTVCRDHGQSQLDQILSGHHLVFPDIDDLRSKTADVKLQKLDTDLSKPMKDYRKQHSEMADNYIAQVLKERLKQKEGFTKEMVEACEKYLFSCVKYAWMMVVQDPPVYMEWEFNHNDPFDNNRLRSYTKGGKHVDYVVWPVLYLHKGGPLLSKGVAQGMK